MLEVKEHKVEEDFCLWLGYDGEDAVQVVWIFVRETWRLNSTIGGSEVSGTVLRACLVDLIAQGEAGPLPRVVRGELDVERGARRDDGRRCDVPAVLAQQVGCFAVSISDLNEVILAIMLFDFEVRVEVEDNLLVGLRSVDDPLAVLVGGVVIGVAWGGDVPGVLGVQAAPTRLSCCSQRFQLAVHVLLVPSQVSSAQCAAVTEGTAKTPGRPLLSAPSHSTATNATHTRPWVAIIQLRPVQHRCQTGEQQAAPSDFCTLCRH